MVHLPEHRLLHVADLSKSNGPVAVEMRMPLPLLDGNLVCRSNMPALQVQYAWP